MSLKELLAGNNAELDQLLAKGPMPGNAVPINPGFGLSGRTRPGQPYPHPGDFRGQQRAPQSLRGSRAPALIPPHPDLLAGGETLPPVRDRRSPSPYIENDSVDIDLNWFSPFQPVYPFGPPFVNYPREWDYPVGANLDYQPRRFKQLEMFRALASSWGVLSTVIEARIDELVALPWRFQLKDAVAGKSAKKDPRIEELTRFFQRPDRKHAFPMWMRMIFRDRYIIDAATTYIWRNATGTKPYAIEPIDGATIKPLIDDAGRLPDWPNPAYQQIIKGLPMNNYTEREILYMPARPRTDLPIYGYPEVEQIMLEATEGIRKTLYMVNFWNEGTMPDMMLGVPEAWTPEQIAAWQATFDALLSGNLKMKSKLRFIPGGMKPFELKGAAGEHLKSDYDEWITRIICFAFRIMPKPFIKEPASRAAVESEKENIIEQGLEVEMLWWKTYMDTLVSMGWGYDDIELAWADDADTDAKDQAAIDEGLVKMGIMTIDEIRDRRGLPPIVGGDVPLIYTATGAVRLSDIADGTALAMQQQAAQAKQPAAGGGDDDDDAQDGAKPGRKSGKSGSKPAPQPADKGGATAKAADPLARGATPWRSY